MMDEMAEECQYRFPEEKIPPSIFMTVYHCAKSDRVKSLVAALNDIPNQELHTYLLNARFEENDGQTFTPLVLAARYGNSNFIRTILDRYNLDLECEGNVLFDGLIVYGVTALWTAAMMGYLNIVKFLVHRGANINHNTKTNSSPLRAACYMGRLDIVKYLINHGADVNLANIYKNTCIMIASYKGHTPVVEALLKAGADPNEQALCSATALHYAAEGDHLEVCELLLDHGAKLQKNEHGLTPVLQAADRSHANIVEMFINRPGIMTTHDKIVALELMGASFATDKKNYNVASAYQYLMNAMEIRYMDPDNIIRKHTLPPIPAYDNWIETETIQDLQAIRLNHHSIHMEALTVRERILGKNHPDLPQPIVYRGAIFADQERFEMSCTLWNYAIDLRMNNDLSVERDLLRFAQLFSQMIRLERNLDLSLAVSVLVKCQQEIENNRRKIDSPGQKDDVHRIADELDSNVVTALYLTKIITILIGNKPIDDSQIRLVYTTLQNLIRTDTKLRDGQTLLHRALNGVTPVDNFYTSEVCRFPCFKTALVLISAQAPVTAEDCERNTPLHVLISSIRRDNPSHIAEAEKCIRILANAGAHLDAVNAQGLTALQLATVASVSNMLVKYQNQFSSLKCIAARSVAFYKLKYKGFIPTILEKFVHMHSTEKLDV